MQTSEDSQPSFNPERLSPILTTDEQDRCAHICDLSQPDPTPHKSWLPGLAQIVGNGCFIGLQAIENVLSTALWCIAPAQYSPLHLLLLTACQHPLLCILQVAVAKVAPTMSEAAVEHEVREYAARRMGGTGPRAQELIAKATRAYMVALRALDRFGNTSPRFWDAVEVRGAYASCLQGASVFQH